MRSTTDATATAQPGVKEPHSTFGRLFMYSKDTLFVAHENFTTEALASCIRSDPAPMLVALRSIAGGSPQLTVPVVSATWMRATTQVHVSDAGIVDTILTIGDESRIVGEVWIEAKIRSPQASCQLAGYARTALEATARDGLPRNVVALSKVLLDDKVAWLDWRRLYVAASSSDDASWQDFRLFMEETHVSDVALLPVTDREAGSIADAARMIAKVSSVIREVNRRWPGQHGIHWNSEGALMNHVGLIFRQSGRMAMEGEAIRYGAVDSDGTAYWFVSVPSRGKRGAELERIITRARERGLDSKWDARVHLAEFLVRTVRVAELPQSEVAVAWINAGLEQLLSTGLIADVLSDGATADDEGIQASSEDDVSMRGTDAT